MKFPPEEEHKGEDRDNRSGEDEVGAEPVIFLALVEEHLQCADEDDEEAQSPVVDTFALFTFGGEVGWVFDESLG